MQESKRAVRAGICLLSGLMCLAAFSLESRGGELDSGRETVIINYENLRELLKAGNLSLKNAYEDYEDNVEAYQDIWAVMKREQGNLEDKAKESEEAGEEDSGLYASNASSLKRSASSIYRQIENMTSTKSTKSLEKSADTYTLTAQALMNSYGQMVQTIEARVKSVEALTAVYNEAAGKQAIGSVTEAEVLSAQDQLHRAVNSLGTLQEQAGQLRRQILTMVGLAEDSNAVIGAVPEPDLGAIDSIDFEADKKRAINNNSSVINTRHTSAGGTAAVNRRFKEVDEAEGTAEADITSAYQALMARRIEYRAALLSYDSALISYESLERKRQAGLLSNAGYLQGEADYLESRASKEIASMNLVQAYEDYCWGVKGVT